MTRHRGTAIAVGLVVVAVTAVAAAVLTWDEWPGSGPNSEGPLRDFDEHGIEAEGSKGTVFTDGFEVLQLTGEQDATIVSVESIGGQDTFRQLGALVAGPERRVAAISYLEGFPPTDELADQLGELVEAEGAVIRPFSQTEEMGYELLIGYEIIDDSRLGYRPGVRMTYRVGGEEYVWESPGRILYCPESMTSDDCHREADEMDWSS